MDKFTEKTFSRALGELLQEKYGDVMGRYTLAPFLDDMAEKTGKSQEYIRLMLRGKRPLVMPEMLEAAAEILGLSPHYFVEYRRFWLTVQMRDHPILMTRLYELALAFLEDDKA